MLNNRNFPKYSGVLLTIFIVIIAGFYSYYKYKKVELRGVFVVVRVDSYEGDADGASLNLTVFYNNKQYKNSVDQICKGCYGKYYYAQILKGKPEGYIKFYGTKEVPKCITTKSFPPEGWLILPSCE